MTRHEARETAFIILFEKLFRPDDSVDEIVSSAEESDFFQVNDFILSVTGIAGEKQDEIDGMIEKNLVGWTIKRISKVSLAVLRLAVCEILYFDDIPVSVSINEAVEITKKYSTAQDASFVNGVLGSVSKSVSE
ncbi:MAG: transcription antitermination factor NusB [Oscillospiraceae bacterium]|nr:transcription antitermination factor NusB [Oscillospiraceae bacterium]